MSSNVYLFQEASRSPFNVAYPSGEPSPDPISTSSPSPSPNQNCKLIASLGELQKALYSATDRGSTIRLFLIYNLWSTSAGVTRVQQQRPTRVGAWGIGIMGQCSPIPLGGPYQHRLASKKLAIPVPLGWRNSLAFSLFFAGWVGRLAVFEGPQPGP